MLKLPMRAYVKITHENMLKLPMSARLLKEECTGTGYTS